MKISELIIEAIVRLDKVFVESGELTSDQYVELIGDLHNCISILASSYTNRESLDEET